MSQVESSIYMADTAQRRGAGRLLYEALVDTLRAQGFVHAFGMITLPNDSSIALHEAVGFRRTGVFREAGYKHGQWIDVGIWQCELNEPAEPAGGAPRAFRVSWGWCGAELAGGRGGLAGARWLDLSPSRFGEERP